MKRFFFPVLIFIALSLLLFGCQKAAIENAIDDFESAVNDDDADALDSVISSDSQFRVTNTFDDFLGYFDGFRPVSYSGLDIETDGPDATVDADASYNGTAQKVQFIMKRDEAFFAFLFPDWKVKEYWDNNNTDGTLEFVWLKIKKFIKERKIDK
jgi:uncharacterized membrane protein YvbJ